MERPPGHFKIAVVLTRGIGDYDIRDKFRFISDADWDITPAGVYACRSHRLTAVTFAKRSSSSRIPWNFYRATAIVLFDTIKLTLDGDVILSLVE